MKKLSILFIAITFASCSSEKAKDTNSSIFMENKLNEFIAQNPNWLSSEAIENETTDRFQHEAIKWSNEQDFLLDMPLQLKKITDTMVNALPLHYATFKAYNDNARPANSLLNLMQVEIAGIVSDEQLSTLSTGKNYTLTGTLHKQGKRADVKFIHVTDFKGYDLGKYTFFITAVKPL